MAFFILTRFVLVKYSRAFVERPSQGTSLRLTTVSLDTYIYIYIYVYIYMCARDLQHGVSALVIEILITFFVGAVLYI